ncbi:ATP-dependent nuclease [Pantoea eucrina]|uniref:ATP-dependent nuclease n=1 Tax=Pantoea eucrina TaxID=472693 RepID=UPI003CF53E3D
MIEEIKFRKFKKIIDINFTFDKNINVISGTNGTCKTTLLHLISNGFQLPLLRSQNYANSNCFRVIKAINKIANPKIEAIVRESKSYTDPAEGMKGSLFSIKYLDNSILDFRKHNSKNPDHAQRYALKPLYPKGGSKQSLPAKPVMYLGLSRLFPIGETKDSDLTSVPLNLPEQYTDIISQIYKEFVGINISNIESNNIGDFKSAPLFDTDNPEIDSNTISSGEDNLFIIIKALVSLRYYFDSLIISTDIKESLLLIDEFDATLHPSLQTRLLDKIKEYSEKYKIQVFITTHSLSLLEHSFVKKYNVIYLMNNMNRVFNLENPDYLKISMFLKNLSKDETYLHKKIPVFTEDEEARFFLDEIFSYWISKNKEMAIIRNYFHFVDCSIGADNLKTIFLDPHLSETSLKSVCVLDGDHQTDLTISTIALPGNLAPEELIFKHAEIIYNQDDESFWLNPDIYNQGFTKEYYLTNIQPKINSIETEFLERKEKSISTKGFKREKNKSLFNSHKQFFRMILRNWLERDENFKSNEQFYNGMKISFQKVCAQNGIDRSNWQHSYIDMLS